MMNIGLVGITLLCCLFVSFRIDSVSSLNSEGLALLSLLSHFDTVPIEINSTWKKNTSETTPCNNWFGVICDDDSGKVETLNLSGSEVSGQLGSEIGELKSLITLDLSNNSLSGPLPSSLGNCTSLQYLDLSENGFSGEIPDHFGSLKNLTYLYLTSNFFSGELPESLFQLPLLQVLNLDHNNLTGLIPASVGELKELSDLTLSHNDLSGPIPESIGNCSKLEYLYLHKNKLNGSLPESLNLLKNLSEVFVSNNSLGGRIRFGSSNCKKLVALELSYNHFEGGVPPELGNCSNLDSLVIIGCNLTGSIPSSLGMLRKVTLINLGDNRLSGNIPHELGNCSSLHTLKLNGNQLQGEIPAALGNLKKLQSLELFENKLSGEIPISVWKIQSLTQMVVHNNTLTGELPAEVTELKNLKKLLMFNNSFHGGIPMSLGVNRSLEEVDLIGNSFTGEIPPNLCHGQKLRFFNLGSNQLHGSIPPSVGQCKTLERIWLGGNKLSGVLPEFPDTHSLEFVEIKGNNIEGSIPRSLGSCKNLQTIDFSQNKLTGLIPPELGNLQNLQRLNLSHNHLEGPLPSQLSGCVKMLEFDVGSNSLNGSVSSSFISWKSLTTLVLSHNRFSGAIPPFLAEFGRLIDLQVARNAFEGEIPSSLGSLKHLNSLDLSGNGFTGEIPAFLGGLVDLVRLNISNNKLTGNLSVLQSRSFFQLDVSNNQLTGPIPEKLMNSSSVFTGNPSLCIQPSHSVSAVIRKEFKTCKGQAKLSTWMIAIIAVGSFLSALALLFALVLVFTCCKRGVKTEDTPVLDEEEGLSLLLNKVLTATDNLDDKYIIGRGAHGVVYKASLAPGEEYAVKKLIFAESVRANQNMKREIETIGQVRHRNLVRLERFWIMKDNGLMLYKYMPNGSLHDVLHRGNNQGETGLDWSARFNIALGIAHGLEYLHHDCHPPIIHRDIKPENILMDSEMEPHIGDFGLARILDDSTISTATITGTTGYIAPENAYKTVRCKESDVYSYGVVLLELITGKRAVDRSFPEETDIVSWVRSVLSSYEDDEDYTVSPIDYYAVLGLKPSAGKRDVKKQYKKMAVLLHPDKNKCIGADGAFHLVSEAWKFLSNEFNKSTFYYKRKKHIESSTVVQKHRAEYAPGTAAFDRFPPSSSSERLDTFWTVCTSCKVQYEYLRKYVNKRLSCKNCRGAFIAVETGPAPVSAPFHYTHPSHAPPPLHSNGYSSHSYDARMPTNSTYLLGHHYPSQGHGYEYGSYDWSSSYPETASPGNLDLKRVSSVSNGYPYKHSKSVATTGIINKVKDGSNGTSSMKTKPDGLIYANPPGLSTHTAAVKVGRPEKKSRVFIEASVNGFVENPLMRSAPMLKTTNADFKLHGQSYGSTRRWSTASVLDTRKPLLQKARADIKQRLDTIRLASEAAAAAAAAAAAVEEDTTPVDSCKLGDVTAGRKTSGPITVPDSDFHDFDKNRSEECFEPRQIWAIYDEDDGMPRLYCVVREVISLEPFKIDIAYLSSKTDIEFGSMKWVQYGFTKSCGHFRIQNYDVVEQVNIFSHLLRGRKTGRGGCVRIFPKTGDIWAVYKNWSLNWNESTPDEVRHEYEMVEILDEYTEQYGVCIAPLVKLEGYKTVYHRSGKEDGKKWIPRSEMLRFSHQVPSWFLKGATSGFPGNCWDLDPAAIPEELLHVGAEA